MSLADFDPKDVVSVRWYNVLSFKFMQPDLSVPSKKSSTSSDSSSVRENVQVSISSTETSSQHETTQYVSHSIRHDLLTIDHVYLSCIYVL